MPNTPPRGHRPEIPDGMTRLQYATSRLFNGWEGDTDYGLEATYLQEFGLADPKQLGMHHIAEIGVEMGRLREVLSRPGLPPKVSIFTTKMIQILDALSKKSPIFARSATRGGVAAALGADDHDGVVTVYGGASLPERTLPSPGMVHAAAQVPAPTPVPPSPAAPAVPIGERTIMGIGPSHTVGGDYAPPYADPEPTRFVEPAGGDRTTGLEGPVPTAAALPFVTPAHPAPPAQPQVVDRSPSPLPFLPPVAPAPQTPIPQAQAPVVAQVAGSPENPKHTGFLREDDPRRPSLPFVPNYDDGRTRFVSDAAARAGAGAAMPFEVQRAPEAAFLTPAALGMKAATLLKLDVPKAAATSGGLEAEVSEPLKALAPVVIAAVDAHKKITDVNLKNALETSLRTYYDVLVGLQRHFADVKVMPALPPLTIDGALEDLGAFIAIKEKRNGLERSVKNDLQHYKNLLLQSRSALAAFQDSDLGAYQLNAQFIAAALHFMPKLEASAWQLQEDSRSKFEIGRISAHLRTLQ